MTEAKLERVAHGTERIRCHIFGYALCPYLANKFQSDLYRIPLVLKPLTYAFAALVMQVSAAMVACLIVRKLKELDLVTVLKTRK